MSKDFWNARYHENQTVYGHEPNEFFKQQIDKLVPGALLLPGEGEGRNGIYAARLGWKVTAYDYSEQAQHKALKTASQWNVTLDYQVQDINDICLPNETYDAIALIYIHLPPVQRHVFHRKCAKALKPGGTIILEAFDKEQLKHNSGGPKIEDMLYTAIELEEDFGSLKINLLKHQQITLTEGPFHQGLASVIRLMATKPLLPAIL